MPDMFQIVTNSIFFYDPLNRNKPVNWMHSYTDWNLHYLRFPPGIWTNVTWPQTGRHVRWWCHLVSGSILNKTHTPALLHLSTKLCFFPSAFPQVATLWTQARSTKKTLKIETWRGHNSRKITLVGSPDRVGSENFKIFWTLWRPL